MNILGLASHGLSDFEQLAVLGVVLTAIGSLVYAWLLRNKVYKKDKGTEKMQEVWGAIKNGANAYLQKQLRSILPLIAVLTIALFFSVYIVPPSPDAKAWHCPAIQSAGTTKEAVEACVATMTPEGNVGAYKQVQLFIGLARAFAFVMGAGFSLTVGQIGMRMAVEGKCACRFGG